MEELDAEEVRAGRPLLTGCWLQSNKFHQVFNIVIYCIRPLVAAKALLLHASQFFSNFCFERVL